MNLAHKYDDTRQVHYAPSYAIKADDVSSEGEFSGHAAVFGNVDQGGDMIIEGAFADTLRDTQRKVRVLWNHLAHEPIGHPTHMEEDSKGLFVKGLLNQGVQRAREARALAMADDIDGLSIGFRVAKGGAEFDEDRNIFRLLKLELREFSFATFPMNMSATLAGMKSEAGNITTVREFEQYLLDTTNFTRKQAAAIASHGFKAANQGELDADANNAGELQLDFSKAEAAIRTFKAPVFHRVSIL